VTVVGAERNGQHILLVANEAAGGLTRSQVPQTQRGVPGAETQRRGNTNDDEKPLALHNDTPAMYLDNANWPSEDNTTSETKWLWPRMERLGRPYSSARSNTSQMIKLLSVEGQRRIMGCCQSLASQTTAIPREPDNKKDAFWSVVAMQVTQFEWPFSSPRKTKASDMIARLKRSQTHYFPSKFNKKMAEMRLQRSREGKIDLTTQLARIGQVPFHRHKRTTELHPGRFRTL
jgi:hypothetical protein